ncbi:serine/threonine-protein kinase [Mycobacterium sp. Marseille-P9652]|uniref:serine/threonine-protein kinase n=1 Tax=Mycobacterium sp. Marseille-P9652 TaxID=2654950 RepID=UPI00272A85F6|nr:serine/threonine-protein kinase [Mycobacterium sp. Marseille-P9652]
MPEISPDKIYDSAMPLDVGQVFAGYRIVRVLGSGGMGQVYLAAHPRLPREDALKVLPADLTTDPEFRARFLREADLVAGLSHPHIVRVHDRGECEGHLWISMDYVAGTDVGRLLREHYPNGMPLDEVVPIVAAVASALDYAHHRGLLHRDVKPANILLTDPDGQARRVFLADFGIARRIDDATGLTETNMTVGTAAYAAPEQLKGEPVDGRADQYALACTAFHLLTGAQPYVDSNPAVVISQHVNAPPPSIGARRADLATLEPVFATAMAKDPSGRFGSCGEFAAQLGSPAAPAYAGELPGRPDTEETRPGFGAVAPTVALPTEGGKRPRRAVLIGALAAAAALAAGGVVAGLELTGHHAPATTAKPTASATPKPPPPNTGPFTGVYKADFGRVTSVEGQPAPGLPPTGETWGVRSVCGASGCVATASRLTGETMQVPTVVFDQLGDTWQAVSLSSGSCNNLEGEVFEVITLQARPDGSFAGESAQTQTRGCANKRAVTFTRLSDVDLNSLADPATLPPRVVSPAEGLRGHYRETGSQPNGYREANEFVVHTDCTRAGDRCISLFHKPPATAMALVFGDGHWVYDREFDSRCPRGGVTSHVHITAQFPLPQPPQDPVTQITAHGHEDISGPPSPCGKSTDVDIAFTRLGD